jgi:hypothetical protein
MTYWIPGTLELTSKVRYALSSRGVPSFRFIPYTKNIPPFAVGYSGRDLSKNIYCLVEPDPNSTPISGQLQKAHLIQVLPTELDVLLWTYAYNSLKELRKPFPFTPIPNTSARTCVREGFTFHIDPPGCKDVDDSFTFLKTESGWKIWIHIADVAFWISEDSPLDQNAFQRAISFYSLEGQALIPMLPSILSEEKAPLNKKNPALSLSFLWIPGSGVKEIEWQETFLDTPITSYTYEQALELMNTKEELQALASLTSDLGGNFSDSHSWVEQLMILYNSQAGQVLRNKNLGVLRKHSSVKEEKLLAIQEILQIDPSLSILAFESAQNCLASDPNPSHFGLKQEFYAYASSPLRRYTDLINQRCLKHILFQTPLLHIPDESVISHLNKRQKQAKQFTRDLFFSMFLQKEASVKGVVLSDKVQVLVPAWKRIIKLKTPFEGKEEDQNCTLQWYCDPSKPRWKERIVFATLDGSKKKNQEDS